VRTFLAVLALLLTAGVAAAQDDVALIDQNGRHVRFNDLVKDKLVVVNFIFTSCTTVCSPMGANFAALQRRLGTRNDVALISVSIDPTTDTPAKLKSWSARFGARPGWTLVTGAQNDVDRLLKSLRVYSPNRFSHAPVALIGRDARWERVNGLLEPEKMVRMLDELRTRPSRSEASTK
jgi:protein SCO1/2